MVSRVEVDVYTGVADAKDIYYIRVFSHFESCRKVVIAQKGVQTLFKHGVHKCFPDVSTLTSRLNFELSAFPNRENH